MPTNISERFLTADEIFELTGSKQPKRQAEVLSRNGVYYIVRRDGHIRTTWHHINHPSADISSHQQLPDFSAIS